MKLFTEVSFHKLADTTRHHRSVRIRPAGPFSRGRTLQQRAERISHATSRVRVSADPAHSSEEPAISNASHGPHEHTGQSGPLGIVAKTIRSAEATPQSSASRSAGSLGIHGTHHIGQHIADSWESQPRQPPRQQASSSATSDPDIPRKQQQQQHQHQQQPHQEGGHTAEHDAHPQVSQAAPRHTRLGGAQQTRPWTILGVTGWEEAQRIQGSSLLPPKHRSRSASRRRREQTPLQPPSRLSMVRILLPFFE